jgi:hypothetical protein
MILDPIFKYRVLSEPSRRSKKLTQPWKTTVCIDDLEFNSHCCSLSWKLKRDYKGYPMIGSLVGNFEMDVDIHDRVNVPFETLKLLLHRLFPAGYRTKAAIKITYWMDESRQDAICTIEFQGFITEWCILSPADDNHVLKLTVVPAWDCEHPDFALVVST